MWDLILTVPDHCLSFYFARHFNFTYRYIEHLQSPNNPKFQNTLTSSIQVEIKETTESATAASYLDCFLHMDNGKLSTRLYDKRDDFNFPIVNLPFLSSNIPSAQAYGVYVSQLIRYAIACSKYQDYIDRGKLLTTRLLAQGYLKPKLVSTLRKFYGKIMI